MSDARTILRKPLVANSTVVVKSRLVKIEGRKIHMESTIYNADNDVLVESTSLFITAKKE